MAKASEPWCVVEDGLIAGENGAELHPALKPYEKKLSRMHGEWFESPPFTPLEWYLAVTGHPEPATALLSFSAGDLPASTRQFRIASPFHAAINRDAVQILPEHHFPWSAADAEWVCGLLNPMLDEDGIRLIAVGGYMLACFDREWDVSMPPFGSISGHVMPNRMPEGADAGTMMRLLSEIQMFLTRNLSESRLAAGAPHLSGLWFWGAATASDAGCSEAHWVPARTDSPQLASLVALPSPQAAAIRPVILHAENAEAVLAGRRLPERIVLAGSGRVLLLESGLLPDMFARGLKERPLKSSNALRERLCRG